MRGSRLNVGILKVKHMGVRLGFPFWVVEQDSSCYFENAPPACLEAEAVSGILDPPDRTLERWMQVVFHIADLIC